MRGEAPVDRKRHTQDETRAGTAQPASVRSSDTKTLAPRSPRPRQVLLTQVTAERGTATCSMVWQGMAEGDQLPLAPKALTSSMFVGDVIAWHGVTPLVKAAKAAGCKTVSGGEMIEAGQDLMVAFMLDSG
jgi:shikimate 5-dehydrogenase